MENIFFTADTHFGHRRMAWFRGFLPPADSLDDIPPNIVQAGVNEMDEHLIAVWNGLVGKGDRVYHLGDFSFAGRERTYEVARRLNGRIHLVLGNHDDVKGNLRACVADEGVFESVQQYKKLKVGEQKIMLFHYPMMVWDSSHYGSWHLHGHSHGTTPLDLFHRRLDVGVDAVGKWTNAKPLHPVTYEQVAFQMGLRQQVADDRHGRDED